MGKPGDPRNRPSQRKRTEQTVQTLIAALLLGTTSGCATFDFDNQQPPQFSARPASRPVTVIFAQRGDTVDGIAQRYGMSAYEIIEANGLSAPYRLTRGQRLILPPSAVHVVAFGDTISSIARSYGVSREAIIGANDLFAPDTLQPGQRIAIPFAGQATRTASRKVAPVRTVTISAPVKVEPLTAPPRSVPMRPIADPRLDGGRYYALGQPRMKPVFDGQGGPDNFDPPAVELDAAYEPKTRTKKASPTKTAELEVPVEASGKFIWPVRGKVISGFGRRGTGAHNDGINILAEPGSPVKAADGGVVVYAGNELAGYGNLLLVRHPSGFVTAYAHNKKILVERGDAVKQGETVALVGSTGDVDRPQLHFEIRKGDRAVDPKNYLSRTTASR
jgi:murein DD-endopeptidase MepM/ murein hydrolase activator NlpD